MEEEYVHRTAKVTGALLQTVKVSNDLFRRSLSDWAETKCDKYVQWVKLDAPDI